MQEITEITKLVSNLSDIIIFFLNIHTHACAHTYTHSKDGHKLTAHQKRRKYQKTYSIQPALKC